MHCGALTIGQNIVFKEVLYGPSIFVEFSLRRWVRGALALRVGGCVFGREPELDKGRQQRRRHAIVL
jgi:hypothetical protein